MKTLLMTVSLLACAVGTIFAYTPAHYTVNATSYTAASYTWMYGSLEIHMENVDTTDSAKAHYRFDGSSTSVTTAGATILPDSSRKITTKNTEGTIYFQLPAGKLPTNIRITEIRK
ncbi:MAG: hypothetical protein A2293_09345 [Elusimicrobia bacterium RIFOXYB2_FULL_49_7]|nr:MAG: hypothetical protein A2293_09345 [Elusimicrobia bacterium RIFOXYB2_FULL_49_7]